MVNRRQILAGCVGSVIIISGIEHVVAQPFVDAAAFGLEPAGVGDQTQALQLAIDAASALGQPLYLADGTYEVSNVTISKPLTLRSTGQAILRLGAGDVILAVADCRDVDFEGITFEGRGAARDAALLSITNAQRLMVRDCRFLQGNIGIRAHNMQGSIENCELTDIADTGIFSTDGAGVDITGNTIARCGNGGIRIWRYESGADGSRIAGNRISDIDWADGGDGENGNGINIFRADEVSVTDNHMANCAFSSIRLNTTNNSRVIGNYCRDSGEVSIFSEFGFSGSIISNNLIEGGAAGISMTNFDQGGRLSVCQGNIVRHLTRGSPTNPDTIPYGIAAEADAAVTGNIVEVVPGNGINVGWGPYLRDVLVNDNLVRDCNVGILVSVAPGAGHARISGNIISGSREHAMVAAQWDDIVSTDLAADAAKFPAIAIEDNSIV